MNPADQPDFAARLSDLAVRFQGAWQANGDDPQAIDLASFLPPPGDPMRAAALYRLIPIDLAGRWRNGVPLSLEDYISRYPEIGPIERVPPQLIAAEYRIRADHGVVSPNSLLKQRFPKQYPDVERLIQGDASGGMETVIPKSLATLLLAGDLIVGDHYRLNHLIGRGGFGEVWHATDLRGNIDKAIKILARSADSEEAQKELESLDLIKKINHPYLLRTESYFVEKDRLFIVLELADATLRDVLKKTQTESRTGIKSDELLRHMKHAAEGLDFLHRQGILHRDIKPENILLVGDFGKVADFGLAKEARNKQSTKADFAGTVVYSAPETWDGRVTTRSDQYSLACTYFEMRTGRILFSGKTFQEVFLKHMQASPNLDPLPDLEQEMLRKALSKKPEDRFETCVAFVKALEDAVLASGSKVVESKPPLEPPMMKTRELAGKTTQEAHTLASLGGSELKPEAGQKWNQATRRRSRKAASPRWPWILLGLLAIAGGAATAAYVLLVPEPDGGQPVVPQPQGDLGPQVVKINPIPNPVIEPKKPPEKVPDKIPEKPPEPPPNPERLNLQEARKRFEAKDFAASRKILESIDLDGKVSQSDADLSRDAFVLYADLLRADAYLLPELRILNAAIADDPAVKPAFAGAMTKRLVEATSVWPNSVEEWETRERDCLRADLKSVLIQAMKSESCLHQPGKRDAARLPAAIDGEPTFVVYVRGRIAASQSDYVGAAEILAVVPKVEPWFVPQRRNLAALILLEGAAKLLLEKEGQPMLFASVADADRAWKWWKLAVSLLNDPSLADQGRLNAALAAAYGSRPEFDECKKIGDALMAEDSFAKSKRVLDLVLAHPRAYSKELAALRTKMSQGDLAATFKLSDEQERKDSKNADLRLRRALLLYTKARLLDRDPEAEPAAILEADTAAAKLEPENIAYRVARARDEGLVAIAAANQQATAAGKVTECERGLAKSATTPGSNDAELWPDLGRVRAILFLDLGRSSDWKSLAAKKAFQDSLQSAESALAKAQDPAKGGIVGILAQAHEALAYLSRVDAQQNYEAADRHYGEAEKREPTYAFQHGRCLFRWAFTFEKKEDAKKRAELLNRAVVEFQHVAKLPDFPAAAEAAYLEGTAYWTLANRFTSRNAYLAFERSLKAAAKTPAVGAEWAGPALQDLVEMTRRDAKGAPTQAASWLASVEGSIKALANDPAVAAQPTFAAALTGYRDVLAETSVNASAQSLKLKEFAKYREQLDKAVEMNHSTNHAQYAVTRAVGFKKNAAALKLGADELTALRKETIAAIERHPEPAVRAVLRKELDAGWQ